MGRYSESDKDRAIAIYRTDGPSVAATEIGCDKATVTRWAQAAGVETEVTPRTKAATDAMAATNAQKREELRKLLMEKAVDLMQRMDEPHIDFKGKDAGQVTYPKATSGDVRNYAVAVGVLIDKFRLENGEATGRTETVDLSVAESRVDKEIERLSQEMNRQDA